MKTSLTFLYNDDMLGINALSILVLNTKFMYSPTHYSWNSWHGWYWKTTIAKFMYSQLTQHYRPYCSFIKVIREEATKTEGLVRLQNQLIRDILKDKKDLKDVETVPEGKKRIKEMLCDKKVLIVLDDVDEQSQLEAAAGGVSWFGSGSRIIVTTRDKAVLKARKVTWIYELKGMSEAHSLQLFSLHAFGETRPRADLYELSRDTVKTGGGLPLYMGVIGRLLKGHLDDKALWKSASIKLKSDPDRGVLGKLKISYDTLEDDAQRAIFLDIACHFIGDNRRYCVYMWDDCDLPGDYGVGVLVSRSLVKMGEGNKFRMHDVLRDLGRYIVRQEKEKPISRLWRCEDAEETLIDCKSILLERPRVISANVGHAWDLPPNTFGAAYAKFMGSRNFSPDDRPPVRFMESDELAYVAMRAREVHDFWHTLFNLPTNLIGESALKVIEFEQMFLPMCLMSVVGGTSRFSEKQRSMFFLHYFPWAAKAGVRCTNLMCIYYEKHFHEDLEDVRKRWGIEPLPLLRK